MHSVSKLVFIYLMTVEKEIKHFIWASKHELGFEPTIYSATVNTYQQIFFTKNTGNEPRKANANREEGKS